MAVPAGSVGVAKRLLDAYTAGVRGLVYVLAAAAGLGILAMMGVTCVDVVLRAIGSPLTGAYDIVKLAGALTIACALPYTTAVKGHVAIEYFFHKLSWRGRVVVDTLARLLGMALFSVLAWQSVRYGASLQRSGQVTLTLQLPVYWVPYVVAFSCGVVVLVILHNLLHPGREMIKP
jgi:TRAP-type C4-dicarboxylate transport system permease small subunit